MFDLVHIDDNAFVPMFETHRHIFLAGIDPTLERATIEMNRDVWSYPQMVVRVKAPNDSILEVLMNRNADAFIDRYLSVERERLINAYKRMANHAARNAVHVTVCRSRDQAACLSGNRWSDGWIVFEDPYNLRDCSVTSSGVCDHGGRVLSVSPGTGNGIYITANHFVRNTVRFYPEGFARASNGTFTACSADGEVLRGMVLAFSGRARVAEAGDNTSC